MMLLPEQLRDTYAQPVSEAEAALAEAIGKLEALPADIIVRLGRLQRENTLEAIAGYRMGLRCLLAMDSCEIGCPHRDLPYYGLLGPPERERIALPKAS